MAARSNLLTFAVRFLLIYFVLIAPWVGLDELYGRFFRAAGRLAFPTSSSRLIVLFERNDGSPHDTRITLGNRNLLDATGTGPVRVLSLNTRSSGLLPVLFLTALILATPVSWRRRRTSLFRGWIGINAFVACSTAFWLLREADAAAELSLVQLPPIWRSVMNGLAQILITHIGAGFFAPVVIWLLVTFRSDDRSRLHQQGRIPASSCGAPISGLASVKKQPTPGDRMRPAALLERQRS